MKRQFAHAFSYVIYVLAVGCLLESPGHAQEKLRIDGSTVAILDSPWEEQKVDTTAHLNDVHVVNADVVWACGDNGTVLKSVDAGQSFAARTIDDSDYPEGPDLISIYGIDDATALAVTSDSPAKIFRTTNGGLRWKPILEYPGTEVSFKSIAFWDERRGMVIGSAVDGRVLLLRTSDGGVVWKRLKEQNRPAMNPDESVMNSANVLQIRGSQMAVIGLGGKDSTQRNASRVLITTDYCRTWTEMNVPVHRSKTSGIYAVHFATDQSGVVIGGNAQSPDAQQHLYAVTNDGGKTWTTPSPLVPPTGFRSSVAQYFDGSEIKLVAVGPNGTDLSTDIGNKWRKVSSKGFNDIDFDDEGKIGWAVGDNGAVAKWNAKAVKSKVVDSKVVDNKTPAKNPVISQPRGQIQRIQQPQLPQRRFRLNRNR